MPADAPFSRVAVLGIGLVGGSFGLAMRREFPETCVIGWDRPEVLPRAVARGAVIDCASDTATAVRGADLIYVALPITAALDLLPAIAAQADPQALVTDTCSTKSLLCSAAEKHFKGRAKFLGGHPIAGKECSGIEHAGPELFRGVRYALAGSPEDADPRVQKFAALVCALGAEPVWCDPETHDWAVGIVSHLPQLTAVALARIVVDETDETGLPASLAGPGLRDMLRLAGSPYGLWRDICLTNAENLGRALDRLGQAVENLRTHLKSRELADEFQAANDLYKMLQKLQ